MSVQMLGKLNKLERILPEGLLVDSGWMNENGYPNSLRAKYVASGRLCSIAPSMEPSSVQTASIRKRHFILPPSSVAI